MDGLRGIAILLVMLVHLTLYGGMYPRVDVDSLFMSIAAIGWCGVDLFFVLSGFLITGILLDTKGAEHYFTTFYARRVLRIFPLYYGVLFIVFVLLRVMWPSNATVQALQQDQWWYWAYLCNFLFVEGWEGGSLFLGHFWSLAIEEQFYLVWPILVYRSSSRFLLALCTLMMVVSPWIRFALAANGYETAAYVVTPARLDALAVGALLAIVARGPGGLDRLHPYAVPAMAMCAVSLCGMFLARGGLEAEDPVVQTFGYTLVEILFGALLVIAIGSRSDGLSGRLLAHPLLRALGRYSYAMYVFHQPVIMLIEKHLISVAGLPTVWGSQLVGQALFSMTAGGVVMCLAFVSWHLYEVQFLRLKKAVPYG